MAVVRLAFGPVPLLPPRGENRSGTAPLPLWAIRVWEEQPPAGEEPLEWLRLTSVPSSTIEEASSQVGWYEGRWVVEDDQQCLKTGCRSEARLMHTADRLMRLVGLLSPVAVRRLPPA